MKRILFVLGLLLLVGCNPIKDYGELRGECIDMYPSNYTAQDICFTQACESFGWEHKGASSWYEATVDCYTENDARVNVEVWGMTSPECKQVIQNRISIQNCCVERGVGY